MDFIPHTQEEFREMLQTVGLENPNDLFRTIPEQLHNPDIPFPEPMTELEIGDLMNAAAEANRGAKMPSFLGGGAYDHYTPQAIPSLASRSEFITAYTPYQPEVSQGTLQAIFEFQTFMSRLTGMDTANASVYDGASALAEAALMACRITRKEKIAVSSSINPHYLRVMKTYLDAPGIEWVEIPCSDGVTDIEQLTSMVNDEFAACFVQNPNYFGNLEPVDQFRSAISAPKCLLGAVVYPHSLGLLKPPGEWGAEIVVGDLQSLGMPVQFGGPFAGFVSCKQKHVRQLPGRLVGRTKDADGKTGYVLTLQTREQHIRRSKATSNICTNQGLCALMATIYMSLMGPNGLRQAAEMSVRNAHLLQKRLCGIDGVNLAFDKPFFNEFVINLPMPVESFVDTARELGLLSGIRIESAESPEKDGLLVCATEKTKAVDIDFYIDVLTRILE